ncbi:MAG: AMP-binding protein [Hyphomicrobiales bacterium]
MSQETNLEGISLANDRKALIDMIDDALSIKDSQKVFLHTENEVITYRLLSTRVQSYCELFRESQICTSDRIIVLTKSDFYLSSIVFAAMKSGVVSIVEDPDATPREVQNLIDNLQPKAIFTDTKHPQFFENELPNFDGLILSTLEEFETSQCNSPVSSIINEHRDLRGRSDIANNLTALIMPTSGTTGSPKGVMLTYENILAQLKIFSSVYGFNEHSRILNLLPNHHVDGLIRGVIATIAFGAALYRTGNFSTQNASRILESINHNQVSHFICVPTILNLINRVTEEEKEYFSGNEFQFIICSADYLDEILWRNFERKFSVMIVNSYGATEMVCDTIFCGPRPELRKVGTLGKPVDCEVRIVDRYNADVGAGTVGELLVRGPTVMLGYFNSSEETDKVFVDDWFKTGDLVTLDEKGFVSFVSRHKDVVISGGKTIYPAEITSCLLKAPDVVEATSLGLAHKSFGEELISCAVVKKGSSANETLLFEYLRKQLAREKLPSRIMILDNLPRGASGKIVWSALREKLQNELFAIDDEASVYKVAALCFGVPVRALTPDSTPFNTDGWDSLNHINFITALEQRFNCRFEAADILELNSMQDADRIVRRLSE